MFLAWRKECQRLNQTIDNFNATIVSIICDSQVDDINAVVLRNIIDDALTAQEQANLDDDDEAIVNYVFETLGWDISLKSELINRTYNDYVPIVFEDTIPFLDQCNTAWILDRLGRYQTLHTKQPYQFVESLFDVERG